MPKRKATAYVLRSGRSPRTVHTALTAGAAALAAAGRNKTAQDLQAIADDLARQLAPEELLTKLLKAHSPQSSRGGNRHWCRTCHEKYPCRTRQEIEATR